jgi:two-component system response regulator AtoC
MRGGPLREQVRRFELALIQRAIEEAGGDRRIAAMRLGIGLSSLYRKLEEYQFEANGNAWSARDKAP